MERTWRSKLPTKRTVKDRRYRFGLILSLIFEGALPIGLPRCRRPLRAFLWFILIEIPKPAGTQPAQRYGARATVLSAVDSAADARLFTVPTGLVRIPHAVPSFRKQIGHVLGRLLTVARRIG